MGGGLSPIEAARRAQETAPPAATQAPAAKGARARRRVLPRLLSETFEPVSSRRFWSDLHHHAVNVSWLGFFLIAAAIFVAFNIAFAGLLELGTAPIANVEPADFMGLFYFSIETLSTVGYGDMHPQTQYAHIVATTEIFTGMSLISVMTGLVFTRFSQPRARIVFARHAVVARHQGRRTLMIRLANERNNTIIGASAKLWLARNERSTEGLTLRGYHDLPLVHHENPAFATTWLVYHEIDADSPLARLSRKDLLDSAAAFILTVGGIDETTSQQLNARHVYPVRALRWNHRFADILSTGPDGAVVVDQSRFHQVLPDR